MADRRRAMRKRGKDKGDGDQPNKEEKAVATHVRFNCPTKSTTVRGEEVHYFTGSKAVDCLLESKWAAGKAKGEPLFSTRTQCVHYLQILMDKGLFWHARKLVPRVRDRGTGDQANDNNGNSKASPSTSGKRAAGGNKDKEPAGKPSGASGEPSTPSKATRRKKDKDAAAEADNDNNEAAEEKDEEKRKNKKKKIKLEFHPDQTFKDASDVYVWHFDPVSWTKFFIGLGLVIGAVVACLFPLWPHWLRLGVYYLSLVAMGLIGLLLALIVLRAIIFSGVWLCSMGRHHFWFLPNLTEDCGVLESFQPLYSYAYYGEEKETKKKSSSASAKKDKQSDNDDDSGSDNDAADDQNTDTDRRGSTDADNDNDAAPAGGDGDGGGSDSEDGGSDDDDEDGGSRKANDTDTNGFEIVN